MRSKLINVRLDATDAAKAAALQKHGVNLSQVLREAIRAEHERVVAARSQPRTWKNARDLIDQICRDAPIRPEDYPPPLDTTDRKAVRARIQASIRRERASGNGHSRQQRHRRSA